MIDGDKVTVNDPLSGYKVLSRAKFEAAWQANGGCGLVVLPEPVSDVPASRAPLFAGLGAALALGGLALLGAERRKGAGAGAKFGDEARDAVSKPVIAKLTASDYGIEKDEIRHMAKTYEQQNPNWYRQLSGSQWETAAQITREVTEERREEGAQAIAQRAEEIAARQEAERQRAAQEAYNLRIAAERAKNAAVATDRHELAKAQRAKAIAAAGGAGAYAAQREAERKKQAANDYELKRQKAAGAAQAKRAAEALVKTRPARAESSRYTGLANYELNKAINKKLTASGIPDNRTPGDYTTYAKQDLLLSNLSLSGKSEILKYLTQGSMNFNNALSHVGALQTNTGLSNVNAIAMLREMYYPTALDPFLKGSNQTPKWEDYQKMINGLNGKEKQEASLAWTALMLSKQLPDYKNPIVPIYNQNGYPVGDAPKSNAIGGEFGFDHVIAGLDAVYRIPQPFSNGISLYGSALGGVNRLTEGEGSTNIKAVEAVTWQGDMGGVVWQAIMHRDFSKATELEFPNSDFEGDLMALTSAKVLLANPQLNVAQVLQTAYNEPHYGARYEWGRQVMGLQNPVTGETNTESSSAFATQHAPIIEAYGLGLSLRDNVITAVPNLLNSENYTKLVIDYVLSNLQAAPVSTPTLIPTSTPAYPPTPTPTVIVPTPTPVVTNPVPPNQKP